MPLVTRDNAEKDLQFTQEVRLASVRRPVSGRRRRTSRCKWQAGAFLFTQNYDQDAVNTFAPFLLSPFLGFPVSQHSPQSALDDVGFGLYGQATATFHSRFDLAAGARLDHESKEAVAQHVLLARDCRRPTP